jgi:hypothetical protein
MGTIKTLVSDKSVTDFIESSRDQNKKEDSYKLLEIFEKTTGEKPRIWGTSIIGYGQYHYKSEKSKQEGDWPLTGFSPRKQNLTIYIMPGFDNYKELLSKLGKHTISTGSCLYIKRLTDVNMEVLEKIIKEGYEDMKKMHEVE